MLNLTENSSYLIGQWRSGIHQSLGHDDGGSSRGPNTWGRYLVSQTPYLGRQRLHPAGYRPLWCGSPWWRLLHPAAPRRCWHWRCCCSCSCSSLCGTAALTPFSNTPVPWMRRRGEGWDIHTMFVRILDYGVYRMKWFSGTRTEEGHTLGYRIKINVRCCFESSFFLCELIQLIFQLYLKVSHRCSCSGGCTEKCCIYRLRLTLPNERMIMI